MSIEIREVDVVADRERLMPFLREHLRAHANPRHYEWLYLGNPLGRGRAWIARSADAGEIVGVAAAFPRRMHVDGRAIVGWNLGDFAIRVDHRSLGPAVKLQRACLREVLDGSVPLAYDHPACNMMAIYRWIRISETGVSARFAKPLRIEHRIEQAIGRSVLSRGVGGAGNLLLSLADGGRKRRSSRIEVRECAAFDESVSTLDRRLAMSHRVVGARSAEYLNWRYLQNPHASHQAVLVGDSRELRGFAVLRVDEGEATIKDLVANGEDAVVDALLGRTIEIARASGVRTVSAPVLETSPLVRNLEGWGFRKRGASPFVVATRPGGPFDGLVNDPRNWYHTDGDRDV